MSTKTYEVTPQGSNKESSTLKGPAPVRGESVVTAPAQSGGARHELIAKRAYELWVSAGRPKGQAEANWLNAEHQLRVEQKAKA